jgi:hypothetical protein
MFAFGLLCLLGDVCGLLGLRIGAMIRGTICMCAGVQKDLSFILLLPHIIFNSRYGICVGDGIY